MPATDLARGLVFYEKGLGCRSSPTPAPPLSSRRMTDDPIRALLAGIDRAPFIWAPKGYVVILQKAVDEAGGDPDEVLAWVEAQGGQLDRTIPVVATRRGVTSIPKPVGKRYYVVPEEALAG